jgi:cellulose biosynthesis protein BcsQ
VTGSIATFYSYKGGVGRSFLVANVAALLARWGYRVLCVDWDIEAPGLDEYFRPWLGACERPGLVELVTQFARDGEVDWRAHVSELRLPGSEVALDLITAGMPGPDMATRVQAIDWRELYDDRGFGAFLETMRDAWKAAYDLVLVDSRTGISDIGGICTVHLPDILVAVFTANQQSLRGIKDVVQMAEARRSKLPLNRAGLLTLPVLARLDARGQDDLAKEWLRRIADELTGLYETWLEDEVSPRQFLEVTRIPYFSVWTFGERLAVLEERDSDPEYISYHIATIAALLARGLDGAGQLCRGRDAYVDLARAGRRLVSRGATTPAFKHEYCVTHSPEPPEYAELSSQLADELRSRGHTVFLDIEPSATGQVVRAVLDKGIESSQHFVVLRGSPKSSPWLRFQLATFAETASADASRLVFDVQLSPATPDLRGSRYVSDLDPRRFRRIDASSGQAVEHIVDQILPGSKPIQGDNPVDDHLRARALDYMTATGDRMARHQLKDILAREMGAYVRANRISHDALVHADLDGLTVALAEAVSVAPQAGDLDRLLEAGSRLVSTHASFRALRSIHGLLEQVRLQDSQRVALEKLTSAYAELGVTRGDAPLIALANATAQLLKNLA